MHRLVRMPALGAEVSSDREPQMQDWARLTLEPERRTLVLEHRTPVRRQRPVIARRRRRHASRQEAAGNGKTRCRRDTR